MIYAIISVHTMVAPTGVPKRMDTVIPRAAHSTLILPAKMTTALNERKSAVAHRVGKTTKAEIKRAPTYRIATTITTAQVRAMPSS